MIEVVCRCCQSVQVSRVGQLPNGRVFAGKTLAEAIPGGNLWRCGKCLLLFRHPILPAADYDQLYERGSSDFWSTPDSERLDFKLIKQLLGDGGQSIDVLDVGCYTGQLLASLPPYFQKFGVEINMGAADIATRRGINMLGRNIDELAALKANFDTVIACDVIEHLPNPLDFLSQLSGLMKPGGKIIVTTGNADAWLWRVMGANFWYCHFPEHISFIGRRWLRLMVGLVGLRVDRLVQFNYLHEARFAPAALTKLAQTLKYHYKPSQFPGIQRTPGMGATRDHIACLLRKT